MGVVLWRVYERPWPPGHWVLVDRLWPRGLRRADAPFACWCRELAPTDELRRWYGHEPERWPEFRRRYLAELEHQVTTTQFADLVRWAADDELVVLTATRDVERSGASVLASVVADAAGTTVVVRPNRDG